MKIIAILTAVTLGCGATAALAQATQTVGFADLDLAVTAGRTVLAHRIAHAAGNVCGTERGTTDLASHMAARDCERRAIAAAMTGVELKTAPRYASR